MASRHITVASVVRIDFVRASDPAHVRVNRPETVTKRYFHWLSDRPRRIVLDPPDTRLLKRGRPMKRTVVNRLIRIAISKRTRLIKAAQQRLQASATLGPHPPVGRALDGPERRP